ncbi:MAG: metal ABC transporter substrate-binding protein [Anaerolineae bacterium]|nr:metal ABC transporter substrate-binding protein [Anaerolineae bacterium]
MQRNYSVGLFILTRFIAVLLASALPPTTPTRAQTGTHIVASFSILADVAQAIAGDAAVVETLIPVGQNPHSFQPTPQDVVTLSEADAVLLVGIDFEEGLLPVLEETAANQMVVVSDCVPIRPFGDDYDADQASADHAQDGAQEHTDIAAQCASHHTLIDTAFAMGNAHDHSAFVGMLYEGVCEGDGDQHAGEHAHDAGSCDPHVWTDPVNVALWTLMIRDALTGLDPANAELYTANAEVYLGALAELDHEIREILTAIPAEQRYIVTNHLAFNYFAARYELEVIGAVIPGGSTGAEPSAQDVVRLIETIMAYGVSAIFTETTVSTNLAEQIADETGADIVQLYTGSLSDPDGPAPTYLEYIRFNTMQIAQALQ